MLDFLSQNWGTILVGAILAAVIIGIIVKMRKDRKNGKGSCGCGGSCDGCPSCSMCHKK